MFKCVTLSLVLAAGCTFDGSNSASNDGSPGEADAQSATDASTVDGAIIDAATIDAAIADASPPDASPPDADPPDATPPDATPCVGDLLGFDLLNMDACDPNNPVTDLILDQSGTYFLNSNTGVLTDTNDVATTLDFVVVPQVGGPDLFVTTATNLRVDANARLQLFGNRPVAIISTSDADVSGRILASSRGNLVGAGANIDANCAAGAGTPGAQQTDDNGNVGGSGGGGAGFGTEGGDGARLANSSENDSPGGAVAADVDLVPLRGGCAGGIGGIDGGPGGNGGGAFQLVAAGNIALSGVLSASAQGGQGVTGQFSGGGGAGSGGGILLQADTMSNTGIITTNGGGGGEGSVGSTNSDPGNDGSLSTDNDANGGSGLSNGGNGGIGATINNGAGDGTEGNAFISFASGGGGGGGGLGVVRIDLLNP